jgi:hypothetical protein
VCDALCAESTRATGRRSHGLVEGRPREAATFEGRSGFDVGKRPRNELVVVLDGKIILRFSTSKEGSYEAAVTDVNERDPQFRGAVLATDFAGIVPASRGAHCRPLHPRLAFLCSVLKVASAARSVGREAEPDDF